MNLKFDSILMRFLFFIFAMNRNHFEGTLFLILQTRHNKGTTDLRYKKPVYIDDLLQKNEY